MLPALASLLSRKYYLIRCITSLPVFAVPTPPVMAKNAGKKVHILP